MKNRKNIINTTAISSLKELCLNGINQKVLIEGKSSYNPVLICLHGLGSSIPFTCGSRGLFPEFTNQYTMVYWDQLGSGINNCDISTLGIDDYIAMTIDLVKEVRNLFPNEKIYLLGISWGSLLALKVMANTDYVDGAITYGQVSGELYFSEDTYNALDDYCQRKKILGEIQTINDKEVHDKKDILQLSKHIKKYTNGYIHKDTKHSNFFPIVLGNLKSPDYKLKDFKALFKNGFTKNDFILSELISLDVKEDFIKITKPYYIVQGADDLITPTSYLIKVIEETNNNNIRLNVIERASHIPSTDAMDYLFGQLEECFKEKTSN